MEVPLVIECSTPHKLLLIRAYPYSHSSAGLDYNLTRSTLTLSANDLHGCFSVEIKDDDQFENTENFFVDLSYSGTSSISLVSIELNEIEIKIRDNDGMPSF